MLASLLSEAGCFRRVTEEHVNGLIQKRMTELNNAMLDADADDDEIDFERIARDHFGVQNGSGAALRDRLSRSSHVSGTVGD